LQVSPYEIALIAGGFTILGALLGTWLAFRFSLKLADINSKRVAGLRLREAFAPELAKLQHSQGYGLTQIPHILQAALERHQAAINEFRFFLKGDELDSLNKAWKEYYYDPYGDKPDFNQYTEVDVGNIQKAIDRIQAILEFTKN
jgi:hypothetical protein